MIIGLLATILGGLSIAAIIGAVNSLRRASNTEQKLTDYIVVWDMAIIAFTKSLDELKEDFKSFKLETNKNLESIKQELKEFNKTKSQVEQITENVKEIKVNHKELSNELRSYNDKTNKLEQKLLNIYDKLTIIQEK